METVRTVELFAGVGGFRLGLEVASDRYKKDVPKMYSGPYGRTSGNLQIESNMRSTVTYHISGQEKNTFVGISRR